MSLFASPQRRPFSTRFASAGIAVVMAALTAFNVASHEGLARLAWLTGAMDIYRHADDLAPHAPLPTDSTGASNYVIASRWPTNPVTYTISNCPSSLDCTAAQQAVREAVEAWDAVSGLTLNEVSGSADITILWAKGEHGDGNPFDGAGGVLAHAFFPVPWLGSLAGDVHLDDDEVWVTSTPTAPWQVHLGTTVMHEVGHALGLDHSDDPSALMWEEYTGVRGLAADDIAGIQSLYGPPDANDAGSGTAPTTPPSGSPSNVTATTSTTLRLRSAPSFGSQQVGSVPSGSSVPVLGRNARGDWLYVVYNSTRGWVAGWYCTIQGSLNSVPVVSDDGSGAAPAPNPPANPSSATAIATATARIRSGPGTSFAQVGTLPYNAAVLVLGRNASGTWLYIDYNGTQGWVAAWLCAVSGNISSLPVLGLSQ